MHTIRADSNSTPSARIEFNVEFELMARTFFAVLCGPPSLHHICQRLLSRELLIVIRIVFDPLTIQQ
jgi:hypothetical protein